VLNTFLTQVANTLECPHTVAKSQEASLSAPEQSQQLAKSYGAQKTFPDGLFTESCPNFIPFGDARWFDFCAHKKIRIKKSDQEKKIGTPSSLEL